MPHDDDRFQDLLSYDLDLLLDFARPATADARVARPEVGVRRVPQGLAERQRAKALLERLNWPQDDGSFNDALALVRANPFIYPIVTAAHDHACPDIKTLMIIAEVRELCTMTWHHLGASKMSWPHAAMLSMTWLEAGCEPDAEKIVAWFSSLQDRYDLCDKELLALIKQRGAPFVWSHLKSGPDFFFDLNDLLMATLSDAPCAPDLKSLLASL